MSGKKALIRIVVITTAFSVIQIYVLIRSKQSKDKNDDISKTNVIRNVEEIIYRRNRGLKQTIKSSDLLEIENLANGTDLEGNWRENAMLYKVLFLKKRFMTFGIPTTRRENASYIFETVESLLKHTSKSELQEIYIVILLADFDDVWRQEMFQIFKNKYLEIILDGTLQIIQAPNSFYPPLDNLEHTYQDPISKRKWRSKQNVDYGFMFMYSQYLATYYMQLEDDIYTTSGYIGSIKDYITEHKDGWTCIEFSELGFIGKLFHSTDLEKLAKMTLLFYEEQPVDVTYLYFNTMMFQPRRILRKPTLFQHVGWHSSCPASICSIQPLKDRFFVEDIKKFYKGDNPPATCYTTLNIHPEFHPQLAYSLEDGYFWAHDAARVNDSFTVVFNESQSLDRVVIRTGFKDHPVPDKIENAILEGSLKFEGVINNNAICTDNVFIGKFHNGTMDVNEIAEKMGPLKIKCLKIILTTDQIWWIAIKEIAVFVSNKSNF